MNRKVIAAHVLVIDAEDMGRHANGAPFYDSQTETYALFFATPTGDGGWSLETWHPDADGDCDISEVALIGSLDTMAARVAEAIAAQEQKT